MTIHLVTFSDASMEQSAELCVRSAERYGVDDSLCWHHEDFLLTDAYLMNRPLFGSPRGFGFWAWKPQVIHWLMENRLTGRQFMENSIRLVKDGDFLIYADAGVEFINSVRYVIDRMDQDIFLFGNNWEHAHWCKRDVVEAIWPMKEWNTAIVEAGDGWLRQPWQRFGKQVQASVIFFRVSDYSRRFVKEWLEWCLFEGGRLIDDSPSRTPNHPEFREHRHDQAILTTMAYRDGIKLHYWPAMYNDGAFTYEKLPEYAGDDYPTLFHHHRRRNHEWGAVA